MSPGPAVGALAASSVVRCSKYGERVNPKGRPQEFLQDLVSLIGQIVRTKVAVAGKRGRSWVVAAESTAEPSIAVHANGGAHPFDRMSATPGVRVELWRTPDRDWTLVGLAGQPDPPVILILEGDWTPCALVFRDLARSFFFSEGEQGPAAQSLDAISQHLTRALADTSGLAAVGEVVLHHVVQAYPVEWPHLL